MGFSSDYLYYFHYSDSMGYLIFCCHSVAMDSYKQHIVFKYFLLIFACVLGFRFANLGVFSTA